jgi:hypothetical protein
MFHLEMLRDHHPRVITAIRSKSTMRHSACLWYHSAGPGGGPVSTYVYVVKRALRSKPPEEEGALLEITPSTSRCAGPRFKIYDYKAQYNAT